MTIRDWLNSDRNFAVGVALYESFGTDPLLKQMFAQGHSPLRENRLLDELVKLKEVDLIFQTPKSDEPRPEPVVVAAAEMPEQKVTPAEDKYRSLWLPKYQEMNLLRHNLEHAANDTERGISAFRILELEQECMAIWSARDYHIATGREAPLEEVAEAVSFSDHNNLFRRIATVRSYVTKYSKPSSNKQWPARLEQYQAELNHLMSIYKKMSNG